MKTPLRVRDSQRTRSGPFYLSGNPPEPPVDSPAGFDCMDDTTRRVLLTWIKDNFRWSPPIEAPTRRESYGYKHDFEAETGLYVTNGEFKGAMQASGYAPVDDQAQNWRFYAVYLPDTRWRGKL